jgi:hypothetical protein
MVSQFGPLTHNHRISPWEVEEKSNGRQKEIQ